MVHITAVNKQSKQSYIYCSRYTSTLFADDLKTLPTSHKKSPNDQDCVDSYPLAYPLATNTVSKFRSSRARSIRLQ